MRQTWVQHVDHSCKAEVDTRCDECWRDGERDKVHEEGVEVENVVVQHNSADVADDLTEQAERYPGHKGPCLEAYAEEEMWDYEDAEDGCVEGVTC